MPKVITEDLSLTKNYIPKVSQLPSTSASIARIYRQIEDRNIHEGRIIDQAYYQSNYIEHLFTNIGLECLFQINEPIIPRFILDFYSQVTVQTDDFGFVFISFMIQHHFITLTLAQFGQILQIPFSGQSAFTNEWDLGALQCSRPTHGPYVSEIPSSDEIHQMLGLECVTTTLSSKSKHVSTFENRIPLKELRHDMRHWEELIRENAFGSGEHRDHLLACLAHMLYCIVAEQHYNLAYFFIKRIECARANPKAYLLYGMFLTRLYNHVIDNYPDLDNSIYQSSYPTFRLLKQTSKAHSDKGKSIRPSILVSFSYQEDDDEEDL